MDLDALFKLHQDIPREAPGSDDATLEAIKALPPLPEDAKILDMGCGPGKQTLALARELRRPITAIDIHEPYLDRLRRQAADAGLGHLITTLKADMGRAEDLPCPVDLVWAEGSIYILGFGRGLNLWTRLLRENGLIVASEISWLVENPPEEARTFWAEQYPGMTDVDENIRTAEEQGFEVFGHRVLPQEAWWNEYYTPLQERMRKLAPEAEDDPALANFLLEQEREIDICRRFLGSFGYVFYLMRKTG